MTIRRAPSAHHGVVAEALRDQGPLLSCVLPAAQRIITGLWGRGWHLLRAAADLQVGALWRLSRCCTAALGPQALRIMLRCGAGACGRFATIRGGLLGTSSFHLCSGLIGTRGFRSGRLG
eukprot:CAMPEP_0195154096 /NCGR_PEP_ID=MMETSP0448-20130528/183482_1 /TAXON_ID=66468 /ORGANISM="Heterocapsa triquestra, Strain CCMP 448" /LENGTH=119 /DNA_ID=CAMNT_0040192867 /DNA_START=511 /DNA_END=866 /DNA_ORIENTATION=+